MFPKEYINFGKITHTYCTVSVFSDHCHASGLQLPCGSVRNAYWQGNNVHVEMADGWHYIIEGFGTYSSRWKE